ncbi:diadenylate cyclase CdaA [Facklamia miroungae]|uniref:Diadenylate cyclase n=1 Tax=Facklamia miroungae TaxID=120956 RepID=A0A1G7S5M6_9LACT|nr:diadenylate cyclase CdaA [Facklamia miroungae]NKZ29173.1 TIGR00159 family protein [Facklamia miroungae]SDG17759.1 diadenylate cyclase [Facklamia miroungae]
MLEWLNQFLGNHPFVSILDILIVWFIIYRLIGYAKQSRAMNLLQGIGLIIFAKFLSQGIGLQTIDWILGQVISWGVVALIILFQAELRKVLENLGKILFRNRQSSRNPSEELIEDLKKSLLYMSKRKIGALISIEAEDSLAEYIGTGTKLDSEISSQLLINIFIPNTPLHDGAVIITDFRIASASCYLPLSESKLIPKELGTRHRAAIGLGEKTDALTLIVSEETGAISIVKNDFLHRDVDKEELHELLNKYLFTEVEKDNQENENSHIIKNLLTMLRSSKGGKKNE